MILILHIIQKNIFKNSLNLFKEMEELEAKKKQLEEDNFQIQLQLIKEMEDTEQKEEEEEEKQENTIETIDEFIVSDNETEPVEEKVSEPVVVVEPVVEPVIEPVVEQPVKFLPKTSRYVQIGGSKFIQKYIQYKIIQMMLKFLNQQRRITNLILMLKKHGINIY
jgi:hypothetical protein